MTRKLHEITAELLKLAKEVRSNKELPTQKTMLVTVVAVQSVRAAVIELDQAIYARHKERHPLLPCAPPPATPPDFVLDAGVRADIDETP